MVSYNTAELRRQNRNRVLVIYTVLRPRSPNRMWLQNLSLSLPPWARIAELLTPACWSCKALFDSTGGRKPKAIGVTANFKYSVGIMLSNRHIHYCPHRSARPSGVRPGNIQALHRG